MNKNIIINLILITNNKVKKYIYIFFKTIK